MKGKAELKTAQTRLGHSDPRLTLAIYAQATSEADRSAAARIGARFLASGPNEWLGLELGPGQNNHERKPDQLDPAEQVHVVIVGGDPSDLR